MFLTSSLLPLPTSLKPHHPSPFLHGSSSLPSVSSSSPTTTAHPPSLPPSSVPFTVQAMKKMQGRVVCATSDKTVAVEVVRLAPHPKYKRRVRIKKKYQAHDPENQFKVGDYVQLEKSRPISKMKAFLAVPLTARNAPKPLADVAQNIATIPLESQMQQ